MARLFRVLALMALASACFADESTLAERLAERREEQEAAAPEELAFAEPIDGQESNSLSLHSGPGSGFDILVEEVESSLLIATGNATGAWTEVRYGDFEGWVIAGEGIVLETTPNATAGPVRYIVDGTEVGVNLREEPESSSPLVSGAPVGSEVVGTGMTSGRWVQVIFNDVTGWAWGDYLEPLPR